jgi:N-acetylneuraminic acid mutarotase
MTPLEESGSLYAFSPKTSSWRKITPTSEGPTPEARSYHCSTATTDSIIIHSGCGNADVGRLNDLWAFDIKSQVWSKLPDAPGDPRGGSAITFDIKDNRIWRFGGFNGKTEVGGVIDHFDLGAGAGLDVKTAQWHSITFGDDEGSKTTKASYPGARSVTGLHILPDGRLITFFGEGKPSPTGGHDAAGNFYGDVWLWDAKDQQWAEVEQEGEGPGERGWFGSDAYSAGAVVWGGIDSANDRISDGWILKVGQ